MRTIIKIFIYFPLYLYFIIKDKNKFRKEINRWYEVLPINSSSSLLKDGTFLLSELREFRSLLYYRYEVHKYNIIKLLYPPQYALFISPEQKIGDGLVIQHGYSTVFNCESMGNNCQVWQCVTIGKSKSGLSQKRPRIGNNVKICTHAVVIGDIEIGDNVTIGASSVVTKSVPPDCTVVGNPARIIMRGGSRTNELL